MLEKIISIKNVGRFLDYSSRGDVSFRKLNLIFADNGQGKTTLCAILHSLQTGQPEYLSERKTLGNTNPVYIQLLLAKNIISFSNGTWSATHSDIAIFDSEFIHNNVYAGDHIDHDHKKNLYRVILGTQGVQLARQVDALDAQIRDVSSNIRSKKEALSKYLPRGVTLENYLEWQPVVDVEMKIQQKSSEIATRQLAVEKASEIQSMELLEKIQLPALPTDFTSVLGKQLTDLIADAEELIRRQISRFHMGEEGETWLAQGMGYIRNDECPFCGNNLTSNDLIAAYRSHFNTAYKSLQQEVVSLGQLITDSIGEVALNTIQQSLSRNLALREFWRQFIKVDLPAFPFIEIQEKYSTVRDSALVLAQRKQENLTQPVLPDEGFTSAFAALESLQEAVDAYNATVDDYNVEINKQKATVQQEDVISPLKKELDELVAKQKRFGPEVIQICQEYQSTLEAKTLLGEQKQAAKDKLDQYSEDILQTYQESINGYLDQFNTGFRIVNTTHDYRGGTPRSVFQIQINNTAIDVGDPETDAGTPCFKTALSAGDRSALALAFFLATLKHDSQTINKIVVLDDPFTSLDRFRRTCTQQLIRKLIDNAQQVIVLSHDPHFLKLIWDTYSNSEKKALQLCQTGNGTVIGELNIEDATQSTYMQNYCTLLGFYSERKGRPLDVARAIRPFLEGLLRAHFPGRFQPSEWLGDFIEKIRGADDSDGLQHAKADLGELEAINNYSKKYHHDPNSNADLEPISETELHAFVKRTLQFVGGVD